MSRRLRIAAVLAFAMALLLAACGGNDNKSSSGGQQAQAGPRTLTIWLMEGSAPPQVIEAVNADFKTAHPNDTVKVQLQQWSNVTTKLDAAFAGANPPDVMELGNT
ncbi:MAG TPA: extracellular solute-binding protein, partial [Actinomycetota bacterium]|nr:extracellular solute-binding protein [Actinomycetota bacterium]